MVVEAPLFKRCCFCFPLRRGLMLWAYFNLTINILALFYFIYVLFLHYVHYVAWGILLMILFIEAVFNIILLVACHKKNVRLFKVSYIYCIVTLVLVLMAAALLTFVDMRRVLEMPFSSATTTILRVLINLAPVFMNIVVHVYVTLLIRSEMVKLREQSVEMQFMNHAADGQAHCARACPKDDAVDV